MMFVFFQGVQLWGFPVQAGVPDGNLDSAGPFPGNPSQYLQWRQIAGHEATVVIPGG